VLAQGYSKAHILWVFFLNYRCSTFLLLKSAQQEMLNLGSDKNRNAKNSTSENSSLANEHFGHLG